MKNEELKDLVNFIFKKDIKEFELERDGVKLRIKRGGIEESPPEVTVNKTQEVKPDKPAEEEEEDEDNNLVEITSPIVGTFYRAPGPDADPFVETGDYIEKDEVMCIVEAMKVMNEIESHLSGEVAKIHVENEQPVEYGEPLFSVEPS